MKNIFCFIQLLSLLNLIYVAESKELNYEIVCLPRYKACFASLVTRKYLEPLNSTSHSDDNLKNDKGNFLINCYT